MSLEHCPRCGEARAAAPAHAPMPQAAEDSVAAAFAPGYALPTTTHVHQQQFHHQSSPAAASTPAAAPAPAAPTDPVQDTIQAMHRHMGSAPSLEDACRFLTELAKGPGGQGNVMRHGGAEAVIRAMEAHPESVNLQKQACAALRHFVVGQEPYQIQVCEQGGIDALFRALRANMNSAELVEKACWVLQQLSLAEVGRKTINANPGVVLILEAMQCHLHSAGVQESASLTLGNLAFEEEVRQDLVSSSMVGTVVEAMRTHEWDSGVQEAAIFALHNVSCTPDHAIEILQAGGETVLRAAIKNHPAVKEGDEAQATLEILAYVQQEPEVPVGELGTPHLEGPLDFGPSDDEGGGHGHGRDRGH